MPFWRFCLILGGKIGNLMKKLESVKVGKFESYPPLVPPCSSRGKSTTPLVFPPTDVRGKIATPPFNPPRVAGGRSNSLSQTFLSILLLIFAVFSNGCKAETPATEDAMRVRRMDMVRSQIEARGVIDSLVIQAMLAVPRHEFVPEHLRPLAYSDSPLPIGEDQTISQPYIVAFMTEALKLQPHDKVLEIGTGSGYQAAVLAEIADSVFTIEIIESLGKSADARLKQLGYRNVVVRIGDGYQGWVEEAPFDAIMVTAAPDQVPQPLIDQLKVGGRLVIPVGVEDQELVRIIKTSEGVTRENLLPVMFVPMTGEAEKH